MVTGAPQGNVGGQTVRVAVRLYLEDKAQLNLRPGSNWYSKLVRELDGRFAAWCDRKRILLLTEVSLENLESYRKEWTDAAISRRKRQELLRAFFRYCLRHKWITENLAEHLSTIRVPTMPTLPLTREQFERVMDAAKRYNPKSPDAEWRRRRAAAMLLLLRWSGLRLGDASRLERVKLTDRGSLRLYTQKTGEGVYVPLPDDVVRLLRELENPPNPKCFFWNGTCTSESTVKRWWGTLRAIFRAAGVSEAHPHMLRDTFAVEYLLAGMPLEQVSVMLGHSSIKVTERHYSPWVSARQNQLEESVRRAWTSR